MLFDEIKALANIQIKCLENNIKINQNLLEVVQYSFLKTSQTPAYFFEANSKNLRGLIEITPSLENNYIKTAQFSHQGDKVEQGLDAELEPEIKNEKKEREKTVSASAEVENHLEEDSSQTTINTIAKPQPYFNAAASPTGFGVTSVSSMVETVSSATLGHVPEGIACDEEELDLKKNNLNDETLHLGAGNVNPS